MATEYSREYIMQRALWCIANPIAYLQEEAEKEGGKLDGIAAISLSKDSNWLQGIARKAIEIVDNMDIAAKEKSDRESNSWNDQREAMYNGWKDQQEKKGI